MARGGATGQVPMRRKTRRPDSLGLEVLKTKGSIDETVELSKSEIRRQKKEKRRKEWEEFNQTKPGVDTIKEGWKYEDFSQRHWRGVVSDEKKTTPKTDK